MQNENLENLRSDKLLENKDMHVRKQGNDSSKMCILIKRSVKIIQNSFKGHFKKSNRHL